MNPFESFLRSLGFSTVATENVGWTFQRVGFIGWVQIDEEGNWWRVKPGEDEKSLTFGRGLRSLREYMGRNLR
jgi:hypothetical protein